MATRDFTDRSTTACPPQVLLSRCNYLSSFALTVDRYLLGETLFEITVRSQLRLMFTAQHNEELFRTELAAVGKRYTAEPLSLVQAVADIHQKFSMPR